MTGLPQGWEATTTDTLLEFVTSGSRGWARYYSDEGASFIRIGNLRRGSVTPDLAHIQHVMPPEGAEGLRTRVAPNDILISITADLGRIALITDLPGPTYINQHVALARPVPGVNARFLAWYLTSDEVQQQWARRQRGATKLGLGLDDVRLINVALPPVTEQGRIVAAIEEQLSRLDAGVAALERVRCNLKRMRAAVLQAAITGKLISPDYDAPSLARCLPPGAVIHSNPDLPPNWVTTAIGAVAHVTSGATPLRSQEKYWKDGSIPWITSTMVNSETISAARAHITPLALEETSVKLMPKGTLLVAMYGEGQTRGRCSELLIEATTNQACAGIVLNEQWNFAKPFIKLALTASYEANRRLSSGGVQPNLSVGIIKRLAVPLPPESEQRRICGEVAAQLSVIDQLDLALEHAEMRACQLRAATLDAAFSGKLVLQDPTEEPASALLQRIAAERAPSEGRMSTRNRRLNAMRREVTV